MLGFIDGKEVGNDDDGPDDRMILTSFVGKELGVANDSRLGIVDGNVECSFNGELLNLIDGRVLGVALNSWFGTEDGDAAGLSLCSIIGNTFGLGGKGILAKHNGILVRN